MRRLIKLVLIAAASATLSGGGRDVVVKTEDFKFTPIDAKISEGDAIIFRNTGKAPHNAQAKDGSFKIDLINPGAQERVVLGKAGTISYICSFHVAQNMVGTIVVEGSATKATPTPNPAVAIVSPEPLAPSPSETAEPEGEAKSDGEPQAAEVPTQKYFPTIAAIMLIMLAGGLGAAYLRFILSSVRTRP